MLYRQFMVCCNAYSLNQIRNLCSVRTGNLDLDSAK
jgi:hypothetical protein